MIVRLPTRKHVASMENLHSPVPGVRIVECGAKEESEKKSDGGKEGEGESKERL